MSPAFAAIVPAKSPTVAKSRLADLPGTSRADLARAFALDTVAAALAASSIHEVLVVTDDFRFASELADLGAHVIPDGVSGDLNATVVQAAHEVRRRWPGLGAAVLVADLPALRPEELDEALALVPPESPAYVADEAGIGTVLYAAQDPGLIDPAFGDGSAAAHAARGAVPLEGTWPGLRHDVDDVAALATALVLGPGPATAHATGR